jgi:hypothetical protein
MKKKIVALPIENGRSHNFVIGTYLYGKGGSEREIKLAMKYVYEKSI